jgi:regulator of replication initiation timing
LESAWTEAILRDRQQLAVLYRQREELRETARRLWFEANAAKEQNDRLRARIDVVQDEIVDMVDQYEHMQASTSWRLTRPLRRLAALRPGSRS